MSSQRQYPGSPRARHVNEAVGDAFALLAAALDESLRVRVTASARVMLRSARWALTEARMVARTRPTIRRTTVRKQVRALRGLIEEQGIVCEDVADLGIYSGLSLGRHIKAVAGMTDVSTFHILVHEYAHELLHQFSQHPLSDDRKELEAEAVAFVVCGALRPHSLRSSATYIRRYGGTGEALRASEDRILDTATAILGAIEHRLDREHHNHFSPNRARSTNTSV